MELVFNPFSITLLLSGSLVSVLCVYIAVLLKGLVRWIALTMTCVAIWGFFYGLELASLSMEDMLFWGKLQYVGIAFSPACWVFFTLKYTDYKVEKNKALVTSLFLLPLITVLLVWTNSHHFLHYKEVELNLSGPFPLLALSAGPWYFINVIYSYLLFVVGILVLWRRFKFADPLHRTQTKILVAGGIFPIFFNLLYQTKLFIPYGNIDLTSYAFLFTYIVVGVAVLKFNLFSIKPIARDKVVEAITKGVLVLDENKMIVDFNPAMKEFNPRIKPLRSTFESIRVFKYNPEILAIIESQAAESLQTRMNLAGQDRIIHVESIPVEDKNSSLTGTILLFEDITVEVETKNQLKTQAADLQQLNDLKDKFFSIISHDLKGPIFGVTELIHLTQTGMISKEEFVDLIPEISKNMTNVSVLLENLLAWSSSQLRGEQRFPENFDSYKALNNQRDLLDRIAKEKDVKIIFKTEKEVGVFADKNMIDLVLRNIINNAIKFSKSHSEIHLTTERIGDRVKICIQDFGAGISPENLEKLKNEISFTTRGQNNEAGTGLGLILVREYLKKNTEHSASPPS